MSAAQQPRSLPWWESGKGYFLTTIIALVSLALAFIATFHLDGQVTSWLSSATGWRPDVSFEGPLRAVVEILAYMVFAVLLTYNSLLPWVLNRFWPTAYARVYGLNVGVLSHYGRLLPPIRSTPTRARRPAESTLVGLRKNLGSGDVQEATVLAFNAAVASLEPDPAIVGRFAISAELLAPRIVSKNYLSGSEKWSSERYASRDLFLQRFDAALDYFGLA